MPGIAGGARLALACVLLWGCLACTRQRNLPDQAIDVQVSVEPTPSPPVVGDGWIALRFRDARGEPIPVANLRLKADMIHPGMTPWLAQIEGANADRVVIPVAWSMGGDWVIELEADLVDGRHLSRFLPIRVEVVNENASP